MDDNNPPSWELESFPHDELSHHGADVVELETPLVLYNNRQKAIGSQNKRINRD